MRGDMAILECEYELNGNGRHHYNSGGLYRKTTGTPFLSVYSNNNNNNNNDNNNDYEDSVEEESSSDSNKNNRNYMKQSSDNNRFFNQQQQQHRLNNNDNIARARMKKSKRYSNNYFSNGDYRVEQEEQKTEDDSSSFSASNLSFKNNNNNYEYPNKYSLQPQEALYSIKWYRDNEEFYRYVPKDNPPQHSYAVEGIKVDHRHSNDRRVVLRGLTLKSRGLYRCEVSAEAPNFETVSGENMMEVIYLPTRGPIIEGGEKNYDMGDLLNLTCKTGKSYPAPKLHWMINNVTVSKISS
uniref:CSON009995 protein n=1 Tax=Culicoides sonorensis TaxID=179676 RepID=A0A336N3G3_CULSO